MKLHRLRSGSAMFKKNCTSQCGRKSSAEILSVQSVYLVGNFFPKKKKKKRIDINFSIILMV